MGCCFSAEAALAVDEVPKYENVIDSVSPLTAGPFLRLKSFDGSTWNGSVLLVTKADATGEVSIAYATDADDLGKEQTAGAKKLWTYTGAPGTFDIYKIDLSIPIADEGQKVTYRLLPVGGTKLSDKSWTFHIAGRTEPWHWAFYSCSGISAEWGVDGGLEDVYPEGILPLWRDLAARHAERPFHALVGGGDQLYNDGVFTEAKGIVEWLKSSGDKKARAQAEFTAEMAADVEKYYFTHYVEHFGQPVVSDCMASSPSVMSWDDHDIFDGWGSYPEYLQKSAVFDGIFRIAKRYYYLFQQHQRLDSLDSDDLFGAEGTGCIFRQLGPRVALASPDTRGERTLTQVVSQQSWDILFAKLDAMPSTVRHVIMLLPVPIVYPHLAGEGILEAIQGWDPSDFMNKTMGKTGLWKAVISGFEEPELLDDMRDHWSSGLHKEEAAALLERCRALAASRGVRVTFISGDVHVGCVALLRSQGAAEGSEGTDVNWMTQIVSSGIGNAPPPDILARKLNSGGKVRPTEDGKTEKLLLEVFKTLPDAPSERVMNRRNWCEVTELEPSESGAGGLHFQLRVEDKETTNTQAPVHPFDHVVPPLQAAVAAAV